MSQLYVHRTADGRRLVRRGGQDMGYQVVDAFEHRGTVGPTFWIQPRINPDQPYTTVPAALLALETYLARK